MAGYVTEQEFIHLTVMAIEDVASMFEADAVWLATQIESVSRMIDGRLAKRYAVPFQSPIPEVVKLWVVRMVTPKFYLRRGVNPRDAQFEVIQEDGQKAWAEVTEAADAKDGLFELPIKQSDETNGITRGFTRAYSERSPYTWTTKQRRAAQDEE